MNTLIEKGKNEDSKECNSIIIRKQFFYLQARLSKEYIYAPNITRELVTDLKKKGVDLFTFVQRSFLEFAQTYPFHCEDEPISLLSINSFDDWWKFQIKKAERNRTRKAEKAGIAVKLAAIDENFIRSSQRIYNETPIRQGRRYTGYGLSLEALRGKFSNMENSEILGAYYSGELVGLLWIVYGDSVATFRSFVSLLKHRDKAPNNALMAEGVKRCCENGFHFIEYGKMGYLPSLDSFKRHNGFKRCIVQRYYVPLSTKGVLALKLKIHREVQYSLPPRISRALLPLYSLVSQAIPANIWQWLSD